VGFNLTYGAAGSKKWSFDLKKVELRWNPKEEDPILDTENVVGPISHFAVGISNQRLLC